MGRGLISMNVVFYIISNQALIQDIEFTHSYFYLPVTRMKIPATHDFGVGTRAIFRGLRLTQHVQLPPAPGSQNTKNILHSFSHIIQNPFLWQRKDSFDLLLLHKTTQWSLGLLSERVVIKFYLRLLCFFRILKATFDLRIWWSVHQLAPRMALVLWLSILSRHLVMMKLIICQCLERGCIHLCVLKHA